MSDTPQSPSNPPRRPDLGGMRPDPPPESATPVKRTWGLGKIVRASLLVLGGLLLGRFLLSGDGSPREPAPDKSAPAEGRTLKNTLPKDPVPSAFERPEKPRRGYPSKSSPPADSGEQATIEALQNKQLASVRRLRADLIDRADEALNVVKAWNEAALAWKKETTELLTADDGKKLATNVDLVKRYRAVSQQELPPVLTLDKAEDLLDTVVGPLKAAQADLNNATTVSGEVGPQLTKLLAEARQGKREYERALEELHAIRADAETQTPGSLTLQQALDKLKLDEARTRAKQIAEKREEAQKKGEADIAAEQARQEAEAKALEVKRLQEIGEMKKQTGDAEIARLRAKAEADKKANDERLANEKRDADLERQRAFIRSAEGQRQIQAYLQPFISPGYTQPTGPRGATETVTQKGPVSLSRLREADMLTDSLQGLWNLSYAANGSKNDRPHWQLSYGSLLSAEGMTERDRELVKAAQALLRDYGEGMVAEGLLAK